MLQAEAQVFIASSDCPQYLLKAERRLSEEIARVQNYLDPTSEAKITRVVETELIGKQVGTGSAEKAALRTAARIVHGRAKPVGGQ